MRGAWMAAALLLTGCAGDGRTTGAPPTGQGEGKAAPQMCPHIYQPVCGRDGKTYSNECTAGQHGVSVASTGKCAGS